MLINDVKFITSAASSTQFIKSDKPIIAVVGKSNVGKSSFINSLAVRKKLAKTSNTPGRTRLINYFDFGEFILADLPGYGYAEVSKAEREKWDKLMDGFFRGRNCDFVISLLDIRHPPTKDDINMLNYLFEGAFSFITVATKSDKLPKSKVKQSAITLAKTLKVTEDKIVAYSSETAYGREEVLSRISQLIKIV